MNRPVQFEVKMTLAMNSKLLLCLALVLSGTLAACLDVVRADETATNASVSNRPPLELTIETVKAVVKSSKGISFLVTFHNNSADNSLLNAGEMLGNGSQIWSSLEAELKTDAGQRIPVTLHWGVSGISGRIYFLGLPLRAGSSYKLPVTPLDFYVGSRGRLKPGRYKIQFIYHGRQSPYRDSTQMPACWEGEVRSNTLTIEVLGE
jgi:hypothetical protein